MNKTTNKTNSNNYKKKTSSSSNKNYRKNNNKNNYKMKQNNKPKQEVKRNYKLVNTKLIRLDNIEFKPTLFNKKFKISKKYRNTILNKLGLLPFKYNDIDRFTKYYSDSERMELCDLFNKLFDNIEESLNLMIYCHNKHKDGIVSNKECVINVTHKFNNDIYDIDPIHLYFKINIYTLGKKYVNIGFNLNECLKFIGTYLKLKEINDAIVSLNLKVHNGTVKINIPTINGFIYENGDKSYGYFINNKFDKRQINKNMIDILKYFLDNKILNQTLVTKLSQTLSYSLCRVKEVKFDKK